MATVSSSVLRKCEGKLCSLLDSSSDTLESLTVELYSNYIIDERTKNSVLREKGYTGARLLLDAAISKVQQSPGAEDDVFKAMETQEILRQLVTEMKPKEQSFTPPRCEEEMGSPLRSPNAPGSIKVKSEQEVLKEANALQDKFDNLLDEVRKHSVAICDIDSLRLRLNSHLGRARENTAAVEAVLSRIDQIESLSAMLNYLVFKNLIGYMNYRLLDVFNKLIRKPEANQLIQDYEDALKRFLRSTDLGTLAQVFDSHPTVAPVTFAGLPQFTVHLNDSWEGKSVHRWDQLLKGKFNWPFHIQIIHIFKECIIIKYGVLPFVVLDVVRDLTNPRVVSLLEEYGVTKIELSDQLIEIAKQIKNMDDCLLEAAKHCSDTEIMELLLKRGANVHTTSTEQQKRSPLHLSAMNGNCAAVELLIEYGADINKEDNDGWSPLHLAAKNGKKEVVELLLKAGAYIHKIDKYDYTTLYYAVNSGNVETVELLLNNGALTNIRSLTLHRTLLHLAFDKGFDEIVILFIKSGANVNEKDSRGNTPLHRAAHCGKKSTVELLLSYNADYTIQNKCGATILHSAAEGGNMEIVQLFLKLCGSSYLHKQSSSPDMCTPLHRAVTFGRTEVAELFLKSGADPSIGGESGVTPLHVAAKRGHERIAELLLQAPGVHPNTADKEGFTPLHSMVAEMARHLQHFSDKPNKEWYTRHVADQQRHIESMLELFIKYGANINEKDKSGFTLLHHAVGAERHLSFRHRGRFPALSGIVKLLLTKGADVNEKDNYGHTPIYYATVHNNEEVVQLLLQFGASKDEQKMARLESSHTESHYYRPPLLSSPSLAKTKPYEFAITEIDPPKPRQHKSTSSTFIGKTKGEVYTTDPSSTSALMSSLSLDELKRKGSTKITELDPSESFQHKSTSSTISIKREVYTTKTDPSSTSTEQSEGEKLV